jgi:hypothetical protein
MPLINPAKLNGIISRPGDNFCRSATSRTTGMKIATTPVELISLASSHTSHSSIRLCARQSRRTKLREFLMLDVLKDGHWAICVGRSEKDSPCLLAFWRQWKVFDTKICLRT